MHPSHHRLSWRRSEVPHSFFLEGGAFGPGGRGFTEDSPDAGTLRVKVIPLKAPTNIDVEIFEPLMRYCERNEGGDPNNMGQIGKNMPLRYQQMTIEQGTKIMIFYWVFGNPVPPEHARHG